MLNQSPGPGSALPMNAMVSGMGDLTDRDIDQSQLKFHRPPKNCHSFSHNLRRLICTLVAMPSTTTTNNFWIIANLILSPLRCWRGQYSSLTSLFDNYLMHHPAKKVYSGLQTRVQGDSSLYTYPILFFAVERNSPELVSLLCKAGANPSDKAFPSCLPVLAYCIISAEYDLSDTTETMVALLAAGASTSVILVDMWEKFIEVPKASSPKEGRQNSPSNGATLNFALLYAGT